MKLAELLQTMLHDEQGSSSVEYALVLSLVALAVAWGASTLADAINDGLYAAADNVSRSVGTLTP